VVGSIADLVGEVAYRGGRLYVAHPSSAVSIVDVSAPDRPRVLATARLGVVNALHGVHVAGSRVYLGNDGHGLRVVGIQDEANPTEILFDGPFQGHVNVVAVGGIDGRVFYADYWGKLTVVDFRDPARPKSVFKTTLPFRPTALRVAGKRLYAAGLASVLAASNSTGVSVFDVGDPEDPRPVDHLAIDDIQSALAATPDLLYVARAGRIVTFDGSLQLVGSLATSGSIAAMAAEKGLLFLLDRSRGLVIVRRDAGGGLKEVGAVSLTHGGRASLALDLPYVYIGGKGPELSIGGSSPPLHLHVVSLECTDG